jgi:hypothetical protein
MKKIYVPVVACILFAACKKDGNGGDSEKKKLLTASAWVYESGGLDMDKNGTVDFSFDGLLPACILDNKGTFKSDGTGVTDEGNTKCDPAADQTTPFNWSFMNNETQLSLSGGGFAGISGIMTIKTLTTTRLTLSKDTTVMNFPASLLVNLKH